MLEPEVSALLSTFQSGMPASLKFDSRRMLPTRLLVAPVKSAPE